MQSEGLIQSDFENHKQAEPLPPIEMITPVSPLHPKDPRAAGLTPRWERSDLRTHGSGVSPEP